MRLSAEKKTSRDRPKSAPYLRLKIPKGLQNVKVLLNWGPFNGKFFFGKKSQNAEKKLKGGTIWDFSKSILSKNIKKLKVRKKSLTEPKILLGPVEFLK